MSHDFLSGKVIRQHTEDGYQDVGHIVHENREQGTYYWIPSSGKDKHGRRVKHHIKQPMMGYIKELIGQMGPEPGQLSLVPFQPSGLQRHSVAMLRDMAADIHRKDRRDINRSLKIMDEQWAWIEPFVVGNPIECLLDDDAVQAFARLRAQQVGIDSKRIVRALRAYLRGGRMKEALLPRWDQCNVPGKPKLPRIDGTGAYTRRAGRKNIAVRNGFGDRGGIAMPENLRRVCRRAWRKYMKRGVSVKRAWALMLAEYFPASSERQADKSLKVKILPATHVPTLHQFRRHGPGQDPAMSVARINLGEHRYARDKRPLPGTARDGLAAACQLAFIDSTPEDQNFVNPVNVLELMPQSYNVKVVEAYTGYMAGFYSSFDRPSMLTNLLALGHAEQDKVDYCARYGVTITPDQWLSVSFKRVQSDNGECKSEEGIASMTADEISAEFTKSYAAELKGPVESAHHVLASGAGHLMAGSSQGRRHERGDENPAKDACQTHENFMNAALRKILYHNNIELVDHLLTLDMRRDGVAPNRGAILKWLIEKGYVATSPTDVNTLRTRCLPRLKGVITRKGVRVFDPRKGTNRHIPHLRYGSAALEATGLTAAGAWSKSCSVHIDPSHLGKAWLAYDGTVEMELQTKDPELANLTLLEWLRITDDERLTNFLDEHARIEVLANDGKAIYDSNKEAKANARKAKLEAAAAGKPIKPQRDKAAAGKAAQEAEQLRRLGLDGDDELATPRPSMNAPATPASANDYDYMAAARLRAVKQ